MVDFALLLNTGVFVAIVLTLARLRFLSIYSGLFIYTAFHFVAFVQRPLAVHYFDLRSEFFFMNYMPTDDVFVQTLLVANLGYLAFTLAYLSMLRFKPVEPTFEIPPFTHTDRKAFGLSFLLLSPLIVYSFILALTVRQVYNTSVLEELGQINMTIDPATGQLLFADTTGYVVFARNMALPFSVFLALVYRGRWWSYFPLIVCMLVSVELGERWGVVVSILTVIIMNMYLRRRPTFTLPHYFIMAVVLVLFVVLGHNRDVLVKFITTGAFNFEFNLLNSSFGEHPDFANFEFLTYVLGKVPDVSGTYSFFTQYLGVLTQPIPRIFWPEKPVGSPIMLVNLQAYGRFASRTTSLVGDGWISLGYAGVVITVGLVGAFYGWLFKRFCQGSVSIYFFCAYFWMNALLLQWSRDGGYSILNFWFFCLTPIILAYVLNAAFFRGSVQSAERIMSQSQ